MQAHDDTTTTDVASQTEAASWGCWSDGTPISGAPRGREAGLLRSPQTRFVVAPSRPARTGLTADGERHIWIGYHENGWSIDALAWRYRLSHKIVRGIVRRRTLPDA